MKSSNLHHSWPLLTGLILLSHLSQLAAQIEFIRSDPKRTDVVSFLGAESTPLPVQVENEIVISKMPAITMDSPSAPLPPWIQSGAPWLESSQLEIRAVVGQWVELTNPRELAVSDSILPGSKAIEAKSMVVWLYLPTGKTYASLRDATLYQWIKATGSLEVIP